MFDIYAKITAISKNSSYRNDSSTIYALYIEDKGIQKIDEIFYNVSTGTIYYYIDDLTDRIRRIEIIDLLYRNRFIKTIGFESFSKDDPLLALPNIL